MEMSNERRARTAADDEEPSCGLGTFRPKFLQGFANSKTFIFVYGLLGTAQAMAFVYFVSTVTTLEKRFQIPSEIVGVLMSGNEVSQILFSMILSYRGGKGNRPLWMAWGVLFSSLSCFILAAPHWIYGPGRNALALTREYLDYDFLNATHKSKDSGTNPFLCSANKTTGNDCDDIIQQDSNVPLVLIFFSQFVLGIGTTLYVTLGQPYLDDNINKKNTPLLLGVTMALRTSGPAMGFILGYLCLNVYISPSLQPVIDRKDPRWIGAWWLGWIILGSVMTVFSLLLAMFPKKLRRTKSEAEDKIVYKLETISGKLTAETLPPVAVESKPENESNEIGFKDFRRAMKRILTNPLLVCNNLCAVFFILSVAGYYNFYNKYIETQFHSSAATASMFAGVTIVSSMAIGFIAAGLIISKLRPRTSYLLGWNIFIGVMYMAGELVLIFIECDDNVLQGNVMNSGLINPESACNANCSCESIAYSPVCYQDGNQTFFSACHAGCSDIVRQSGKILKTYGNCSCLPSDGDVVHQGPCNVDCFGNLVFFLVVQCLIQLVGCSGKITTVLVNYRSIEVRDKELAQGFSLFMISLFAFIPGPIIYGKIIDLTCMVWDNTCGKRGNCWVYDKWKFRYHINAASLCFTFGAVVLDVVVWYLGRNLKLYEEEESRTQTQTQTQTKKS